jgi:catechol 2,3-dioxygenase-like lactoylglutathione lyase family enzyme
MEVLIERVLSDFERGRLTRRQLALTLAGLAAGATMVSETPALAQTSGLKAVTLNHVTVKVPDLHKTSAFYQNFFGLPLAQQSETVHILSVGDSFFGIEQKPEAPGLDHYDFGIQGWDLAEARAKVEALGLKVEGRLRPNAESFKFHDPDGFLVQINSPKYTGHVGPY